MFGNRSSPAKSSFSLNSEAIGPRPRPWPRLPEAHAMTVTNPRRMRKTPDAPCPGRRRWQEKRDHPPEGCRTTVFDSATSRSFASALDGHRRCPPVGGSRDRVAFDREKHRLLQVMMASPKRRIGVRVLPVERGHVVPDPVRDTVRRVRRRKSQATVSIERYIRRF